MSDYQAIDYTVKNRVATITLNSPKTMNAISQQMRLDLLDVIEKIEADDEVRIAVLTGAGRGFSSGTDLSEGLAGYDDIEQQIREEYKPVFSAIENSSKLYISAVNGTSAGISIALALACNLTVMADNAKFFLAFAGIGLVPDGGVSYYLVQALGHKRATQAFVEAARLSADYCLTNGLANKVVAADELLSETQAWAETLAAGSPIAQALGQQCLKSALNNSLSEVVDLEAKLQITASCSEDSMNAAMAFFKKEKPVFTGK